MKVIISQGDLRALEAHLEQAYPNEGAGFLLGSIENDTFRVSRILPIKNRWDEGSQRNRFRLEALDSLRAERVADQAGVSIIGVFHSHPDHPAEPSQWDLAWATWPNFSYLITRVEGDGSRASHNSQTRAWRLQEDRGAFEEDAIETG